MRHAIPAQLNTRLTAAIIGFNLLALFALPVALRMSPWFALLILPLAWVNNTQWGLIHEAIHKILHPDSRTNDAMGRILSLLMGTSFHVLRFGHLTHHKLNRGWHAEFNNSRTEHYWNLLFGLYGSEVLLSYGMALLSREKFLGIGDRTFLKGYPDVHETGDRFFYTHGHVKQVRTDIAVATLLYIAAFAAYGAYWPILIAFVALRGFVISFMDNIYHYATPADNSKAGKELALSRALSVLLLNSNFHETHHLNPLVPWATLPEVHAAQGRRFDGEFLSHGLMQFAGPPPSVAPAAA